VSSGVVGGEGAGSSGLAGGSTVGAVLSVGSSYIMKSTSSSGGCSNGGGGGIPSGDDVVIEEGVVLPGRPLGSTGKRRLDDSGCIVSTSNDSVNRGRGSAKWGWKGVVRWGW
jgi:hypothetical protein